MKSVLKRLRQTLYRLVPADTRFQVKCAFNGWPRICPQIRQWAETTGQAEIIHNYWETHERSRPLPASSPDPMPEVFIQHQIYPLYDRTLYRIPDVQIHGKSGLLTLPDGSVTHQTMWSREQLTSSPDYTHPWQGPVAAKAGNYNTLIFYWGLSYYHWFNDVLSLLFENLDRIASDTRFIIPSDAAPYNLAALDLLGIGPERRLLFDGSEAWKLENLWFQPPTAHPENQTPGAMSWLGRTLSAAVPIEPTEKPQRLYISRQRARTRRVINEDELLPILHRHGFISVVLEDMILQEQIRLFRNADKIVAPHGAGLTNLIYSPTGTMVLELFSSNNVRRCYWALSNELGHSYHFMLTEPVHRPGEESDLKMDTVQFAARLETLLAPFNQTS